MDPLSISTAVASLVTTCTNAATLCNALIGKYKRAPKTLASIRTECTTVKAGLSYVYFLINRDAELFSSQLHAEGPLAETIDVALTGCTVTFSLLDCELQKLYNKSSDREGLRWKDKMRYIWDENLAKELLDQMRGLQSAVSLVLNAIQTGSILALNKMIAEQKSVVDRVKENTRSVCQSRSNVSSGNETARHHEREGRADSYSIFNSSIGDEEFAFDDEILQAHAYRRVAKGMIFRARAQQQDDHFLSMEDRQTSSHDQSELYITKQHNLLSHLDNLEKGNEKEQEERILVEKSIALKKRASRIQDQQEELKKLQDQLEQVEKRFSGNSCQQSKRNSDKANHRDQLVKDTFPAENGNPDAGLNEALIPQLVQEGNDCPDVYSPKDEGRANTVSGSPGISSVECLGQLSVTATCDKTGAISEKIPVDGPIDNQSELSHLQNLKNGLDQAMGTTQYGSLYETENNKKSKNDEISKSANGVQQPAQKILLISEYGSFEILRSKNNAILPDDFRDGILQMMPSKTPTIEIQNAPACLAVDYPVEWLVSLEKYTITDDISSVLPPIKVVLMGSMCGKTSAFVSYATQTPVLISDSELTMDDDYHLNIPVAFQDVQIEVNMILTDTGDFLSRHSEFRPLSCSDADALILCYSFEDRDEYENLSEWWLPNLQEHCPTVPIVLASMMSDVRDRSLESTSTSRQAGLQCAKAAGLAAFVECSSKSLGTINQAFETAIRLALSFKWRKMRDHESCQLM